MTVQFGRVAKLLVGQPGNPGKIGSPGTSATVATPDKISDTGPADFGITAGKPASAATPAVANTPATPGDGLDLSQLRFAFSIRHHAIQTPGEMDLTIYNASERTANLVAKEFTRVQLTAGYPGNAGIIFDGTMTQRRRGRFKSNRNHNYCNGHRG